jgi:hypothetical protein
LWEAPVGLPGNSVGIRQVGGHLSNRLDASAVKVVLDAMEFHYRWYPLWIFTLSLRRKKNELYFSAI